MKKWLVLALVSALMVVLMACGSTSNSNGKGNSSAEIQVSEDEIVSGSLVITASNWKFDKEYYAIRAGEAVELTVDSIDGVHGVSIENTDYSGIKGNEVTSVTIKEPGTYLIRCSIPCGSGHTKMTAKLVVV